MKGQVLMACLAVVAGASAGTATYSFSWYRNAAWIKATYDNLKPGSTFVTVGTTRYPGTILIFR